MADLGLPHLDVAVQSLHAKFGRLCRSAFDPYTNAEITRFAPAARLGLVRMKPLLSVVALFSVLASAANAQTPPTSPSTPDDDLTSIWMKQPTPFSTYEALVPPALRARRDELWDHSWIASLVPLTSHPLEGHGFSTSDYGCSAS